MTYSSLFNNQRILYAEKKEKNKTHYDKENIIMVFSVNDTFGKKTSP
jgi:hypothetical protein